MDWIAEKVFSLLEEILKGDFTNLGQVPALLALIVTIGCFLKRRAIERFIRATTKRIVKLFNVKKAEYDIKVKRQKLRQAAESVYENIQNLERYKHDFKHTKREMLNQIDTLKPSVGSRSCQVLERYTLSLDEKYDSSVRIVSDIQHLLAMAADISRAEELSIDPDGMADLLVSEADEMLSSQAGSSNNS